MGEFGKYKAAIARNNHSMKVQELQTKIEQLDKEKAHLAEMNKRYLGKMQEQQDQIAYVKDVIKKHDRYIPQSTINALEKALRGECE